MYKSGHMGTSLLLYSPLLAAFIHFDKLFLAGLGLIIATSFCSLPDIDFKLPKVRHRGYSHSLIGAVAFSLPIGIIGYFSSAYIFGILQSSGVEVTVTPMFMGIFCFAMGYFTILTHYAGDIVTPSGIPILAPYSKTNYSLGWFYAKNRIANGLALFLGVIATIIAIIHPLLFKLFL